MTGRLLVLLAVTLLAAGCGSNDDGPGRKQAGLSELDQASLNTDAATAQFHVAAYCAELTRTGHGGPDGALAVREITRIFRKHPAAAVRPGDDTLTVRQWAADRASQFEDCGEEKYAGQVDRLIAAG